MATQMFRVTAPGGRTVKIYGEKANLEYFIKTTLDGATAGAPTNKQVTAKAYQRRQYPGDTTLINMPGTVRQVLIDPTAKSGNGLPGFSFVLKGDPGLPGEETRQFTYVGRWIDLHAWLGANAKMMVYAYNHTGRRYTINAAGATP